MGRGRVRAGEKEGFFAEVISFLGWRRKEKRRKVKGSSLNDNWFARDWERKWEEERGGIKSRDRNCIKR